MDDGVVFAGVDTGVVEAGVDDGVVEAGVGPGEVEAGAAVGPIVEFDPFDLLESPLISSPSSKKLMGPELLEFEELEAELFSDDEWPKPENSAVDAEELKFDTLLPAATSA